MMRRIPPGVGKDDVTYIILIENTDKGGMLSAAARKREISGVNAAVKKHGGQCRLFVTRGSPFDFVSVISGITAAAAIRIAEEIESRGSVKATVVSGLELFG
jgi:uncharacterized protein with GYD domain